MGLRLHDLVRGRNLQHHLLAQIEIIWSAGQSLILDRPQAVNQLPKVFVATVSPSR